MSPEEGARTGVGAPPERRRHDRRTGAAFLSLVAATNVIPWMEALLGGTAGTEALAPSEIRIAVGTTFVSLVLLLGVWIYGRRTAIPVRPWIQRPRTAGLRLSIAAAAGNLALAGAVRWLEARNVQILSSALPLFAAIWYLVILPAQLVAAFSLGRTALMPGRRRSSPPPHAPG
jgi:hypothetical protein